MRNNSSIPFVKPSRVGNFKLWRSRFQMSVEPSFEERKDASETRGRVRRKKMDIECINVSNLDGTWKVQIPATFEMFSVLDMLYADYYGEPGESKDRAESILACLLGNMMYASTIGNGYYHRALEIVATCYAHPDILREDSESNADLKKNVDALTDAFLQWRKAYDERVAQQEPTEEDLKHDDIADQAGKEVEDGDMGEAAAGQDED